MSNDTLESRARAYGAEQKDKRGETLSASELVAHLIAFATDEVNRKLEEAVEAVDKMSWMAPETDDVLEAVTRCNVEIRTDVIRVIEALKGGDA